MAIKSRPIGDPVLDIVKSVALGSDQTKFVRRLKDEDLARLREIAKVLSHLSAGEAAAREVRREER